MSYAEAYPAEVLGGGDPRARCWGREDSVQLCKEVVKPLGPPCQEAVLDDPA